MLKDFFDKPFTLDRIARILFTILILIALGWLVRSMSSILIPFFLAWMVAYMLMPIVKFFQNKLKLKNRILSVVVVLLLFFGLLTGLFFTLLPSMTEEFNKAWALLVRYANAETLINLFPPAMQEKLAEYTDINTILANFNAEKIFQWTQKILTQSWNFLSSTLTFLMSFGVVFLFIMYLIFILFDYEDLSRGAFKIAPKKVRPFMHEAMDNITYYVNNYFRGQSIIALILSVLLAIGFRIMDLPLGITFGLITGLFNLIPYLQWLSVPPLIVLCMLKSAETGQNFFVVLGLAVLVMTIVQVIQDVILTPRIMGKTMGMKPAIILLSLSVWGSFFGLLGLLFALPLTMILYTYHMKYVVGEPLKDGALLVERRDSSLTRLIRQAAERRKGDAENK